jgi:hypothetical protein
VSGIVLGTFYPGRDGEKSRIALRITTEWMLRPFPEIANTGEEFWDIISIGITNNHIIPTVKILPVAHHL